jgi:hypothetical protein
LHGAHCGQGVAECEGGLLDDPIAVLVAAVVERFAYGDATAVLIDVPG